MKKFLVVQLIIFINLPRLNCQSITYYNTICTIFSENCVFCHNPNGTAPFSLENLDQIVEHKGIISSVVEKGIMPPWRPDPAYTHFLNERVISLSDKQKIVDWIKQGCQSGMPNASRIVQKSGAAPPADLVLKLPYTIKISASKTDTNVWVAIPYEIDKDTIVSSYEFVPSHNSGIHHVFISIQSAVEIASQAGSETFLDGTFWDGKDFHQRSFSSNYLAFEGGWISGQSPYIMPSGIGWRIPQKGTLIYQLHYGPSPVSFTSEFELRFSYAKSKIERMVMARKYGSQSGRVEPYPPLVVPPDSVLLFTINASVDTDYSIIAVGPHMHLLGKSFKAWLLKPNGDTTRLISIKNWDFNRQGFYFLPKLMKADKGDLLQFEALLDNTSENLNNPNTPPKFVMSGNDTKDEMIQLSILIVPYQKGDEILITKEDD